LYLRETDIERLNRLFNSENSPLKFLAYEANLDSMKITNGLDNNNVVDDRRAQVLWIILLHFSSAEPREKTGRLINFRDLPGGYAYENTFVCRAVQPLSETFGEEPEKLIRAGKALDGTTKSFGEVSIEIPSLPLIPLVYILWAKGEFPASANVLFDESASHFLPTEDLAVLAEITTKRLQEANRTTI
jgi:hypothetical protein